MRRVHCDGCGFTEPEDIGSNQKKIKRAVIAIITDPRFPEGTEKNEADLCPNCQGMMLHEYFKVPAKGKLEVPAFLGPKMLDNDQHSRKVRTQ